MAAHGSAKKRRHDQDQDVTYFVAPLITRRREENLGILQQIVSLRGENHITTRQIFDMAREKIPGFSDLYALAPDLPEAPVNFMSAYLRDLEAWAKKGRTELIRAWNREEEIPVSMTGSPTASPLGGACQLPPPPPPPPTTKVANEDSNEGSSVRDDLTECCPMSDSDDGQKKRQSEDQESLAELDDRLSRLSKEQEDAVERHSKCHSTAEGRIRALEDEIKKVREEYRTINAQFEESLAVITNMINDAASARKYLISRMKREEAARRLDEIRQQKRALEEEEARLSRALNEDPNP